MGLVYVCALPVVDSIQLCLLSKDGGNNRNVVMEIRAMAYCFTLQITYDRMLIPVFKGGLTSSPVVENDWPGFGNQ